MRRTRSEYLPDVGVRDLLAEHFLEGAFPSARHESSTASRATLAYLRRSELVATMTPSADLAVPEASEGTNRARTISWSP